MPDTPLRYLLDFLLEVGPVSGMGFGGPITHLELMAWQWNMGRRLQPWENDMIRRLSGAYCAESAAADDINRAAPFEGQLTDVDRAAIAAHMKDMIRGLAS